MVTTRHAYFAYGSNLCAQQMTRRCRHASDPIPATLADHDWLINEWGVATVEPFPGSRVHGVLWQLSEDDLAALDRAEGVPERYHRDRLTVHTAAGPARAWVYIDHRVQPGPPRDGYLERVIGGAADHGLPSSWIEFLRRWDPACWPLPLPITNGSGPQSLSELLADPDAHEVSRLRSPFGFLAIHGGGLERMTDVIAERAAEAGDASVYVLRHPDGYPHHLPSARFLAEESRQLAEFLDHVDVVVSVHGYGRTGRSTELLAGGGNRALAMHLARCVEIPGYQMVTDLGAMPVGLRGLHPDNPVNRARGGGTQLELSPRIRGLSPRSQPPGDDGLSPATAALVRGLAAAARTWAG